MWPRLQPYVAEAATLCGRGCNPMWARLLLARKLLPRVRGRQRRERDAEGLARLSQLLRERALHHPREGLLLGSGVGLGVG